jgi:hypothetical protein
MGFPGPLRLANFVLRQPTISFFFHIDAFNIYAYMCLNSTHEFTWKHLETSRINEVGGQYNIAKVYLILN